MGGEIGGDSRWVERCLGAYKGIALEEEEAYLGAWERIGKREEYLGGLQGNSRRQAGRFRARNGPVWGEKSN